MRPNDTLNLRIGMLGCASVSTYAMLEPARQGARITIAAVAARDPDRAAAFALEHGIPQAFGSYEALIENAEIDAVYVALPNALHHRWSIAALRAGRPVLCEKPLASNAEQAAEMAAEAERAGLPLVEATHWRDHPAAIRMMEIVRSGRLGRIRRIEARFGMPGAWLPRDNIRFSYALGGGWTMDQGCYCLSLLRWVADAEPERVVSATATLGAPELDVAMQAELQFPGGISGTIQGAMTDDVPEMVCWARIEGNDGVLTVTNPFLPGENVFTTEIGSRLILETANEATEEKMPLTSSWRYQADRFAALVRQGNKASNPAWANPAWEGVANMRAIDDVYRAAGLKPRP